MRIVFIILLLIESASLAGSEPVDFKPNLLSKVLKRKFDLTEFEMKEISISNESPVAPGKPGKFFKLHSNYDKSELFYVYIGRVLSCRTGGCDNPSQSNLESESEYFDYFIIFNEAKNIESVKVFNYQATHGQEVSSSGWLKQFEGYDGKNSLIVGREIDAISGATISADAITMDLQSRSRYIRGMIQ